MTRIHQIWGRPRLELKTNFATSGFVNMNSLLLRWSMKNVLNVYLYKVQLACISCPMLLWAQVVDVTRCEIHSPCVYYLQFIDSGNSGFITMKQRWGCKAICQNRSSTGVEICSVKSVCRTDWLHGGETGSGRSNTRCLFLLLSWQEPGLRIDCTHTCLPGPEGLCHPAK